MSGPPRRDATPAFEAALAELLVASPSEERARLLANGLNRTAAALHRLARDEANARKGDRSWTAWAKLVNASRNAVLAASMCREVATTLPSGNPRPGVSDPSDRAGETS
ncbi:MAG: hypothetical protein FJ033_13395 [Chloroflexi bacterium]|nr:hypothetical protein [Chloroflexota bacterium]